MTAAHCSSVRLFQIFRSSGFKPPVRRTRLWPKVPAVLLCLAGIAAADVSGDFTYVDNGTTITITDYPTNATGAVEIPTTIYDSVTGLYDPVKTIGPSAFSGCNKLTSVTIPIGVTSIGNSAFYFCSALATVNLPDGVTSPGTNAFASCTALANVTIPSSVTSLGNSAFANCAALTSVTIPSGITSIGTFVFSGCSGLTSVTIPSSVTTPVAS